MMKCFLSSYFQLLYLLIAALLECKAQTERLCIPEQVHQLDINCFQGDDMSVSCLTTTDPLESLQVKLRRTNQDKDIFMYPDISPSEHQRWSVRKDAENVTLGLKEIRYSDGGLYDCKVYTDQDCFHATQFNLSIIKCKTLDSVHPTPGSSVLLPCSEHPLQNRTEQVTWKVVTGHKPTDIDNYHLPKKSSSSKEKLPKPLYERVRKQANGSLLIRDVVDTDQMWYQCRVNEKTCYEVKLLMKANNTSHSTSVLETFSTTLVTTASAESRFAHAESNSNKNETATINVTVVVMTTIMFLCVFISLTACVILYFKKRRHKTNSQTQLNGRFSIYYSQVAEGFDVPLYSLVEHNTATMTTFGGEQSEAPECKADDMYENVIL
ncbi:uncharacterized protein LOC127178342 isoform X3 [Labeo rohita]|uniref:uncharacterized protein LOC127178342 isoform X2 n=1 Tax=Labeo rohita TaxID=84645 RepID=UPI0021E23AB2|nr:uncharacterized protein LOC127178342 isoform X2 [Labeo rohita]XP_050987118.1 uncharacterized protein LOC127178342 isoform X3 [Labeo rohita]